MRTRRLGIAAGVVLCLALSVAGAPPAGATRVAPFKVVEGPPVVKDYGPIAGVDAANAFTNPANCETQPSCNVLTLEIVPPASLGPDDDFVVKITLSWDYRKVGTQSTTNLDLIIYDGTTAIGRSTGQEPEVVLMYRPMKGKYELVVVQRQSAPGLGYRLTGEITRETITTPFESLAPAFDSSGSGGSSSSTSPSAGSSGFAGIPASSVPLDAAPGVGSSDAPSIALAPISVDDDLASLSARSGQLDAALRSPAQLIGAPSPDGVPKPVAGAVVAFWALIVPLTAMAAAALWFRTRRIHAF